MKDGAVDIIDGNKLNEEIPLMMGQLENEKNPNANYKNDMEVKEDL